MDGSDFLVWQRHVGSPADTLPNDPTGSPIGGEQLAVWKGNFGAPSELTAAAVPEPSAVALVVLGAAAFQRRRRAMP